MPNQCFTVLIFVELQTKTWPGHLSIFINSIINCNNCMAINSRHLDNFHFSINPAIALLMNIVLTVNRFSFSVKNEVRPYFLVR